MKPLHDLLEGFGEQGLHAFDDIVGDVLIVGLRDASGDASKGIRVAAERDGKARVLICIH